MFGALLGDTVSDYRETAIGTTLVDELNETSNMAMIGITNEGGEVILRYWNDVNGNWVNADYVISDFETWSPTLEIQISRISQTITVYQFFEKMKIMS